ncbi:MAG: hypothetical protein WBQ94_30950 [Terracidiphilus sp.]
MKTGPCNARQSKPASWQIYVQIGSAVLLALLAGCANTEKPDVGPIQFVTAAGAPVPGVTSLGINGVVYLVATVTNDNNFLGVSWTVDCGSLPAGGGISTGTITTACGVFTPAQTASGPVPTYPSTGIITEYTAPSAIPKGNTVTITAHATTLPSVTSSVTLTITAASQGALAVPSKSTKRPSDNVQRTGF